ncbi:4-oxalocrotonate tautomerase [Candidatus Bathyarchaeota archaeon]|nr:MAG: 4-oxalocrotonate tautomerase [Candidatus Bathyarchaeota archaeon]
MPVVEVKIWEGMPKEDKAKIIKGITEVLTDLGIPAEAVTIIIHDIPKHNWGSKGKPHSELFA